MYVKRAARAKIVTPSSLSNYYYDNRKIVGLTLLPLRKSHWMLYHLILLLMLINRLLNNVSVSFFAEVMLISLQCCLSLSVVLLKRGPVFVLFCTLGTLPALSEFSRVVTNSLEIGIFDSLNAKMVFTRPQGVKYI